jgi:hypothetical protein
MAFTDSKLSKLKEKVKAQHIKAREAEGIILHYLEGWHVIAEANRIFGFDGWDRETVHSQCVWIKQMGSRFSASYVTRIKIIVRAGDIRILREGSGAGEATGATPGQVHELALKAAETDATKRALSTFGNAFGLSLYGSSGEDLRRRSSNGHYQASCDPPSNQNKRIDKSVLMLAEPKRLRDPSHLRRLATIPCLICGRKPVQAHHLTFAQARAMGRKSSDEYAVPLCAIHHRDLHDHGNEMEWWRAKNLEPIPIALRLWDESQSSGSKSEKTQHEEGQSSVELSETPSSISPEAES